MPVTYEEPLHTRIEGTRDEIKITHPAYAQISCAHVSGGAHLYGSDFQHQHYVRVTITRSEMGRHLSNDWPHAREELIEIAMTESQWASFVASPNRGQGIQCTLQHVNGKQVPQIPAPERRSHMFRAEGREAAQQVLNRIDALNAKINDAKISQKMKDDLTHDLSVIRDHMKSNLRFVLDQFGEHMEATIQKARTEISAYANHLIVRTGLAKLIGKDGEDSKKMLGYHDQDDEK